MLYASDFREKAREALNGKWGLAVGTGFVASLMGAYTALDLSSGGSSSSSGEDLGESASKVFSGEMLMLIATIAAIFAVVILVITLVYLIISGPTSLGYAKFNLDLVDNNNPRFDTLFWGFKYFGKAAAMQLLRILYIFLWTLCFIIPGIIAEFRYAMAPYIMAENPDISANEAIAESKRLMDGNKWRLFCLSFSFIGWELLSILTLGILNLWIRPYMEASFAAFYREIKDAKYSNPEKDVTVAPSDVYTTWG